MKIGDKVLVMQGDTPPYNELPEDAEFRVVGRIGTDADKLCEVLLVEESVYNG